MAIVAVALFASGLLVVVITPEFHNQSANASALKQVDGLAPNDINITNSLTGPLQISAGNSATFTMTLTSLVTTTLSFSTIAPVDLPNGFGVSLSVPSISLLPGSSSSFQVTVNVASNVPPSGNYVIGFDIGQIAVHMRVIVPS